MTLSAQTQAQIQRISPREEAELFRCAWVNGSHVALAQQKALFAIENRMGFVICGQSGVGKSATASYIREKIQGYSSADQSVYPVVTCELEASTVVKDLILDLLAAMGIDDEDIPKNERSARKLKKLLYRQIIACGVVLIIVDEFQHLLRKGRKQQNVNVTDFLKVLLRETGVSIGLFGIDDDVKLLDLNNQFTTRFTDPVMLTQLSLDEDGKPSYFQWFLSKLMAQYPRKTKNLASQDNAIRLLMASGGNLRELKNILCAVIVATPQEHVVSIKDAETAYRLTRDTAVFRGRNGHKVDAFRSSPDVIQRYLIDATRSEF